MSFSFSFSFSVSLRPCRCPCYWVPSIAALLLMKIEMSYWPGFASDSSLAGAPQFCGHVANMKAGKNASPLLHLCHFKTKLEMGEPYQVAIIRVPCLIFRLKSSYCGSRKSEKQLQELKYNSTIVLKLLKVTPYIAFILGIQQIRVNAVTAPLYDYC